jgi:hypothetical protein
MDETVHIRMTDAKIEVLKKTAPSMKVKNHVTVLEKPFTTITGLGV